MREFCNYHPATAFLYFMSVILLTCFSLNPISVFIAFSVAFTYTAMLKGRDALFRNLATMPVFFVAMALVNPAFNHRGVTVIGYLPSGNPLTFESVCFGLIASGMVLSVILFFSCFNEVMTGDKIVYLFGRISPSLSLIFSMSMRFVPKFLHQFGEVLKVQKTSGRSTNRLKTAFSSMSAVVTWALEDAIETSDSMKSRGYGTGKRSAYSIFTLTTRDKTAILYILIMTAYVAVGHKQRYFSCFPSIEFAKITPYSVSVFLAELLLMSMPVIIEITERIKWNSIKSEI